MSDRKHTRAASGFGRTGTGLHKDWRTWAILVLMLTAIATYVLTLDDSVEPAEVTSPAAQP